MRHWLPFLSYTIKDNRSISRVLPLALTTLSCVSLLSGCSDTGDDDTSPTPPASATPIEPTPTACPDGDQDGTCDATDCAPTDPNIAPGKSEVAYDGVDQDCNGSDLTDVDGDGVSGGATGTDCNDNNAGVNPAAVEDCADGIDNNCDGETDNLPSCPGHDYDKDGVTENQGDCDDNDPDRFPGNIETFDGKDNDCTAGEGRITLLKPNVNITIQGDVAGQLVGQSLTGVAPLNGKTSNDDNLADLVVGAPGYGGQTRGGVAVYFGTSTWTYAASFSGAPLLYNESQPDARAGSAVGSVGDINYDGLPDFAVGSPFYNTTVTDAGRSHIFLGQSANWLPGSLENQDSSLVAGYFKEIYMGTALDGGDVNGDGKDDLLVGARTAADGWVFILPGEGTVPVSVQTDDLAKIEAVDGRMLGSSVAFAGDSNGDGVGDIISGGAYDASSAGYVLWAPGGQDFKANTWYVFENPTLAQDELASYVELKGDKNAEQAGWSVSGNGDINGDGAMDWAAGDFATKDLTDPGVFIYFGGAGKFLGGSVPTQGTLTLNATANIKVKMGQYDACPCSVSLEGDMNADGFDDLLIGTAGSKKDGNAPVAGRVYLFLGRSSWPSTLTLDLDADYILDGASAGEQAGYSVSWIGDFNGDGYGDFAVGAPTADIDVNGSMVVDAGRAYVLYGFAAVAP